MPNELRISVIVPAYNTLGTICESLDSVLSQSYPAFEVIVIDDGSPDNVGNIVIKKYGKYVRVIKQDNIGLAGARNTGIRESTGDYVAFLDSDDVWLPNKLELQAAAIKANPDASIFYSNCYFWENGKITGEWTSLHRQKNGAITRALINREVMLPVLTVVMSRKLALDIGGFDEKLRQVEDYDLWLRLAVRGEHFYGIPEPLAKYRINPAGLSRNVLLMAQTQLAVYQKLLINPDARNYLTDIKRQITVFRLEILHQSRKLALAKNDRLGSSWATLQMVPLRPKAIVRIIGVAFLVFITPGYATKKLV